jgi:hypothetical protein
MSLPQYGSSKVKESYGDPCGFLYERCPGLAYPMMIIVPFHSRFSKRHY